jgi:hypothetical protein
MMRKSVLMSKMIGGGTAIIWAAYLHIALRLRISGTIFQLPPYFNVWHGDMLIYFRTIIFERMDFSEWESFMQNSQLGTRNAYFNVTLKPPYKSYFYKK